MEQYMRRIFLLVFYLIPATAFAQVPQLISPDQVLQQVVTPALPALPPIASLAHLYGDVKLQIVIDTQGHPTQVTLLSGPIVLHNTALRSIRRSSYKPFEVDGKPVPVTTVVTLSYNARTPLDRGGNNQIDRNAVQSLSAEVADCKNALRNQSKPEKQMKPCTNAAKLAESVDLDEWSNGLEDIYLDCSSAFFNNKQFDQALSYANKALSHVALGYGDASTLGRAYLARAEAEIGLNDGPSGSSDLIKAEIAERSAISWIQDGKLRQDYKEKLKEVLEFHAQVLTAAGNQAGAKAKTDEAATL